MSTCEAKDGAGDGAIRSRTRGFEPDGDLARSSRIVTETSEDGSVVRDASWDSFYGTSPTLVQRRSARPVNQVVHEDRERPVNQVGRASRSGEGA
jgi:hypothetical protein